MLEAPKNAGELNVAKDHVYLLIKGKWRQQLSVKNCNKKSCYELVTHEKYAKVHALLRCEKINFGGQKTFFLFDPDTQTWESRTTLDNP